MKKPFFILLSLMVIGAVALLAGRYILLAILDEQKQEVADLVAVGMPIDGAKEALRNQGSEFDERESSELLFDDALESPNVSYYGYGFLMIRLEEVGGKVSRISMEKLEYR